VRDKEVMEVRMRSYQVNVTVQCPITLTRDSSPHDQESMFRVLNALMTEVSLELNELAQSRFENMRQQAAKAGIVLDIPTLAAPMGVSYGISDVTGNVGKKWSEKKSEKAKSR
jgi:hypothetical protein